MTKLIPFSGDGFPWILIKPVFTGPADDYSGTTFTTFLSFVCKHGKIRQEV